MKQIMTQEQYDELNSAITNVAYDAVTLIDKFIEDFNDLMNFGYATPLTDSGAVTEILTDMGANFKNVSYSEMEVLHRTPMYGLATQFKRMQHNVNRVNSIKTAVDEMLQADVQSMEPELPVNRNDVLDVIDYQQIHKNIARHANDFRKHLKETRQPYEEEYIVSRKFSIYYTTVKGTHIEFKSDANRDTDLKNVINTGMAQGWADIFVCNSYRMKRDPVHAAISDTGGALLIWENHDEVVQAKIKFNQL